MNISSEVLGKKITNIYQNYLDQSLTINLKDGVSIIFFDCAIVFDLGIVGHTISFVSHTGTLGLAIELKKRHKDPDDYNFVIMSRDINDIGNKNEIIISYKHLKIERRSDQNY